MSRQVGLRPQPKAVRPRRGRANLRAHIVSLLMLTAILGVILLGVALLIFILRDLWVFIITIAQPE